MDSRLHLAIAEVDAASASLTTAVADVRMRINDLLDRIPLLPPNLDHSNAQHEAIVTASSVATRRPPGRPWPNTWKAPRRCYAASCQLTR